MESIIIYQSFVMTQASMYNDDRQTHTGLVSTLAGGGTIAVAGVARGGGRPIRGGGTPPTTPVIPAPARFGGGGGGPIHSSTEYLNHSIDCL
jgi:hypothetical protein